MKRKGRLEQATTCKKKATNHSVKRPFFNKNEYVMFLVKILFLIYYSTKSRNMNVIAINWELLSDLFKNKTPGGVNVGCVG